MTRTCVALNINFDRYWVPALFRLLDTVKHAMDEDQVRHGHEHDRDTCLQREEHDRAQSQDADKLLRISTATAVATTFIGETALYAFQSTLVGDLADPVNPVTTHVAIDFPISAIFHGHGIGAQSDGEDTLWDNQSAGEIRIEPGVLLDATASLIYIEVPRLKGSMSMNFILYLVAVSEVTLHKHTIVTTQRS